jgi:hypothetical protein
LSLETDLNVETQEEHEMRISEIAAVLHKAAADMEVFAAKNDNVDFPDQAVVPFVMNFLTDNGLRKFPPWLPASTHDPLSRS